MIHVAMLAAALIASSTSGDVEARPRRPRAAKKAGAKAKAVTPPIAFYLSEYGNVKEATREAAIKGCEARRAADRRADPELARSLKQRSCEELLVVVRGPYRRSAASAEPHEDIKRYVYRGSDGGWYDKTGNLM
jgi:hypothetical protein